MGPRLGRVEYPPEPNWEHESTPASMGPRLGRVEYCGTRINASCDQFRFNGATLRTRGIHCGNLLASEN